MITRCLFTVFVFLTFGIGQTVERVEMQTMRLKEKLRLTEAQIKKVHEILAHHSNRAGKERSVNGKNRREQLKASIALIEKTDAEIEKILSKDQKLKFEQYKEERRNEMRERMRERQL